VKHDSTLAISCCGPRQIVLLKRWSVQQERAFAQKFKASQSVIGMANVKNEFQSYQMSLFRWQSPYEGHREIDPVSQLPIAVDSILLNDDPAFHWATGEIHLADIRFRQCNLGLLDTQSSDQQVIPDGDQHVSVQQKADSTKHLLFGDPPTSGKHVSNSFHE
jgi:hypothetical protein